MSVTACVFGNFTSSTDINLILAKNAALELHCVGRRSSAHQTEIQIYGKIAVKVLKVFRYPGENKDKIFILTARYHAMILDCQYCGDVLEIVTVAHGNIGDQIGKSSHNQTGIIGVVNPQARVIGLKLNEGLFTIIPLDKQNSELKAYNIRLEKPFTQDIQFLYGCSSPTVVVIYQDTTGRHVQAREINMKDKDFSRTVWKQDNVESISTIVIPIPDPLQGVIIVGQESILYHNGKNYFSKCLPAMQSSIMCYARVDTTGFRYLLGDMNGHLFMLFLERDSAGNVQDIKFELLGEISTPEYLTYLDIGVVYTRSRLGDCQLIKIKTESNTEGTYVNFMEIQKLHIRTRSNIQGAVVGVPRDEKLGWDYPQTVPLEARGPAPDAEPQLRPHYKKWYEWYSYWCRRHFQRAELAEARLESTETRLKLAEARIQAAEARTAAAEARLRYQEPPVVPLINFLKQEPD